MAARAVGRRDEVGQIAAALADARAGAGGRIVELTGEAGIGKSTVLAEVEAMATDQGWRVWSGSPTAAESELPWTGLSQILARVRPEELGGLVAGHVDQLTAATAPVRPGVVSPEIVAFGLAALLDTASDPGATPLLLMVDDVQWLDPATAGALAFALRGIARRRAVALLARRNDEPVAIEPARLVEAGAYLHVALAGLSLASLREVVTEATGATLSRAELARIGQRTGGNPLYTIELARAVLAGTPVGAAALPASLRDSVGARVRALPLETRLALGAAALSARPTLDRLTATLPDVDVLDALGPAESAGIVELHPPPRHGGPAAVSFTHPLLAAASIDGLTTGQRHDVHAVLAANAPDAVERATHLIARGVEPDEATAAELESAAREAHSAGATEAAAAFAQACLTATPATADRIVRLKRGQTCAQYNSLGGRYAEAQAVLTEMEADLAAALADQHPATALAVHDVREQLAGIDVAVTANVDGYAAAEAAAERALGFTTEPHRRYLLHAWLVRAVLHQNVRRGIEVAERVFGEGSEHDGVDRMLGSFVLLTARAVAGEPFDADAAIALVEATATDDDQRGRFASLLVEPLVWSDHPRSVEITERALAYQRDRGHFPVELGHLYQLADHLMARGDWRRVETLSQRMDEYSTEFPDRHAALADRAHLLAAMGDAEAADTLLERALRDLDAAPEGPANEASVLSRAALVAHTLGRPTAADDLLDIERRYAELGVRSVRGPKFRRDLVEALVAAGRLDEARAAAERLAADAERNQVVTAIAESDAATAVVASAQGDHEHARSRFAAAIDIQGRYELHYELARTLLAAGAASRRANRRAEARRHLEAARELFAGMGAITWVQRCDDEIERLGGRRSQETDELTPTERQIADLVASGMTNAEVAGALFVSVRTVESNLTRVYRKLGIRSRSALARTLDESLPADRSERQMWKPRMQRQS